MPKGVRRQEFSISAEMPNKRGCHCLQPPQLFRYRSSYGFAAAFEFDFEFPEFTFVFEFVFEFASIFCSFQH